MDEELKTLVYILRLISALEPGPRKRLLRYLSDRFSGDGCRVCQITYTELPPTGRWEKTITPAATPREKDKENAGAK